MLQFPHGLCVGVMVAAQVLRVEPSMALSEETRRKHVIFSESQKNRIFL